MFQKSTGLVLGGFQFRSNCDSEQDRPSAGLNFQGQLSGF